MASLCLSPPITATIARKSIPSNLKQTNLANSLSFSRPLDFNPLRFPSISTNPRFSPILSMASSSDNTNEPLGKSVENFGKKPSIEDLLRQQIEKQEYYDEGGGGGNSPGGKGRGGGGGNPPGGRGRGDGPGGSEEDSDETIQVTLATLGFLFIYAYIINGPEMIKLGKDYLTFLFGGRKSSRLARAMHKWESNWNSLTGKKKKERSRDPFSLEKAIINTRTWWDSPEKYMRLVKGLSPSESRPDVNEEDIRDGYDSQGSEEMGDGDY